LKKTKTKKIDDDHENIQKHKLKKIQFHDKNKISYESDKTVKLDHGYFAISKKKHSYLKIRKVVKI